MEWRKALQTHHEEFASKRYTLCFWKHEHWNCALSDSGLLQARKIQITSTLTYLTACYRCFIKISSVYKTWPITNWTKNWVNLIEGKVDTDTGWSWLKSHKINSKNCTLYLNSKAYGKVVNSQFQHSAHSQPIPQLNRWMFMNRLSA